jgi:hypothetical protein
MPGQFDLVRHKVKPLQTKSAAARPRRQMFRVNKYDDGSGVMPHHFEAVMVARIMAVAEVEDGGNRALAVMLAAVVAVTVPGVVAVTISGHG